MGQIAITVTGQWVPWGVRAAFEKLTKRLPVLVRAGLIHFLQHVLAHLKDDGVS